MNQVYSKRTYWGLLLFHVIFPVVFIGILFSFSPYYILVFYIPLGVIILVLLGIVTVLLQGKNVHFGYLIFINLATEVYVWIWILNITLDTFIKHSWTQDVYEFFLILILLLISIFVHLFITSSLFASTSVRKLKTATLFTLLFTVLIGGGMVFNSINSLRPSEWKVYKTDTFGYEIQYPPTLSFQRFNSDSPLIYFSGSARYGTGELEIKSYQSNSQSIEEWLRNEWPNAEWTSYDPFTYVRYAPFLGEEGHEEEAHKSFTDQKSDWLKYFASKTQDLFSKAEKMTVNNYQAIKLADNVCQSYAIFISDGKNRIIKISCYYRDNDIKDICSKMISTLRFTNSR